MLYVSHSDHNNERIDFKMMCDFLDIYHRLLEL